MQQTSPGRNKNDKLPRLNLTVPIRHLQHYTSPLVRSSTANTRSSSMSRLKRVSKPYRLRSMQQESQRQRQRQLELELERQDIRRVVGGERPLYEDASKAVGWMESLLGRAKKILSSLEGDENENENESSGNGYVSLEGELGVAAAGGGGSMDDSRVDMVNSYSMSESASEEGSSSNNSIISDYDNNNNVSTEISGEQSVSFNDSMQEERDKEIGGYSHEPIVVLDSSEEEEKEEEEEEESVNEDREEEEYSISEESEFGSGLDSEASQDESDVMVPTHEVIDIYSDSDQDEQQSIDVKHEALSEESEILDSEQEEEEEEYSSDGELSGESLEAENQVDVDQYSESLESSESNESLNSGNSTSPDVSTEHHHNIIEVKTQSEELQQSNDSDMTDEDSRTVRSQSKLNATDIGEGHYSYNPNTSLIEASFFGSDVDNENSGSRGRTQELVSKEHGIYRTEDNSTQPNLDGYEDNFDSLRDETEYYSYNESTQQHQYTGQSESPVEDTPNAESSREEGQSISGHDNDDDDDSQTMDLNRSSEDSSSEDKSEADSDASSHNSDETSMEKEETEDEDVEIEETKEQGDERNEYVAAAQEVLDQIDRVVFQPVDDDVVVGTNSTLNGNDTIMRFVNLHNNRLKSEHIEVEDEVSGFDVKNEELRNRREGFDQSTNTPVEEVQSPNETNEASTDRGVRENSLGDEDTQSNGTTGDIGSVSTQSLSFSEGGSIYYSCDDKMETPVPDVHRSGSTGNEIHPTEKKNSSLSDEKYRLIISDSLYSSSNSAISEERNDVNESTPFLRNYTSPFLADPFEVSLEDSRAQELLRATLSSLEAEKDGSISSRGKEEEAKPVPNDISIEQNNNSASQIEKSTLDVNALQSSKNLLPTGNTREEAMVGDNVSEVGDSQTGGNIVEAGEIRQPEHSPGMDANISEYVTAINDSWDLSQGGTHPHGVVETGMDNSGYTGESNREMHQHSDNEGRRELEKEKEKKVTPVVSVEVGQHSVGSTSVSSASSATSMKSDDHEIPDEEYSKAGGSPPSDQLSETTGTHSSLQHRAIDKLRSGISSVGRMADAFVRTIDAIDVESDVIGETETKEIFSVGEGVSNITNTEVDNNVMGTLNSQNSNTGNTGTPSKHFFEMEVSSNEFNMRPSTNASSSEGIEGGSDTLDHLSSKKEINGRSPTLVRTSPGVSDIASGLVEQQVSNDKEAESDTLEAIPGTDSDEVHGMHQIILVDNNTELDDSDIEGTGISTNQRTAEPVVVGETDLDNVVLEQVVSQNEPEPMDYAADSGSTFGGENKRHDIQNTKTENKIFSAVMVAEHSSTSNNQQMVSQTSVSLQTTLRNGHAGVGENKVSSGKEPYPVSGITMDAENMDVYIDIGESRNTSSTVSSSEISLTEAPIQVPGKSDPEPKKDILHKIDIKTKSSLSADHSGILVSSDGNHGTNVAEFSREVTKNISMDNSTFYESESGQDMLTRVSPESTKESIEVDYTESSLHEPGVDSAPGVSRSEKTSQKRNKHKYRKKRKLRRPITSEPSYKPSKRQKRRGGTR